MEPRIQYAQTKDGVSIAFCTLGEGMPFVHVPPGVPHIQLEWEYPECRRWFERLAEKRRLVRYDLRGFGLSERDVKDYSLDAGLLDLEAVVDRLGLETFALFGGLHTGPQVIAYAARHPERVSHLILWCTYANASQWSPAPPVQASRAIMEMDWKTYTETVAHQLLGWSEGEPARRYAALIRESVTPEAMRAAVRATEGFIVADLLPRVSAPTLVLYRRRVHAPDVSVARSLASQIPDARLALLEGASSMPYLGDMEPVLAAIDEFLGEGEQAPTAAKPAEPGAFRTILFTDVEGSTALTQRLGDAKAREVLREHERIVREALRSHGGSEVKTMGDGFMASFGSATKALECAVAIQRAFEEWTAGAGAHGHAPLKIRIGLNAGEPIAEEEDLFGTAVIAAARIAARAEGGEILVSDVVRQLVAGKGFLFADRGEAALRGFDDPARLYEVRWREEGAG